MCVERPLRHRVAGDEQEVRAVFARSPLAEEPFVRGRKIGFAHDAFLARLALDEFLRVAKEDVRYLVGY